MIKENLEFCFKGDRNYIQGPDIFDAVICKLQSKFDLEKITNVKYAAHDMLRRNAFMLLLDDMNLSDYEKINSVISFKNDDNKYYVIIIEDDRPVECSCEYSEDIVQNKSVITNQKIEFYNELEDSLTEIIVSMNKYYLQESISKQGKWIVTKFEYSHLLDVIEIKDKKIGLELKSNFNNKLTKSVVTIDDIFVGHLYFSLILG